MNTNRHEDQTPVRSSLGRRGWCMLLSTVFALVALAGPAAAEAAAWGSRIAG